MKNRPTLRTKHFDDFENFARIQFLVELILLLLQSDHLGAHNRNRHGSAIARTLQNLKIYFFLEKIFEKLKTNICVELM